MSMAEITVGAVNQGAGIPAARPRRQTSGKMNWQPMNRQELLWFLLLVATGLAIVSLVTAPLQ